MHTFLFIFDIDPISVFAFLVFFFGMWFWLSKNQADGKRADEEAFYRTVCEPFVIFPRFLEENDQLVEIAQQVAVRLQEAGNTWNPPIVIIPYQGVYMGQSLRGKGWGEFQRFCRSEFIRIHEEWQSQVAKTNPAYELEHLSGQRKGVDPRFNFNASNNQINLRPA